MTAQFVIIVNASRIPPRPNLRPATLDLQNNQWFGPADRGGDRAVLHSVIRSRRRRKKADRIMRKEEGGVSKNEVIESMNKAS